MKERGSKGKRQKIKGQKKSILAAAECERSTIRKYFESNFTEFSPRVCFQKKPLFFALYFKDLTQIFFKKTVIMPWGNPIFMKCIFRLLMVFWV